MIGVHTSDYLRPFAEEFFELFKTPWEFYSSGRHYEALVCCGVEPESYSAQLLLIYSGTGSPDGEENVPERETAAAFFDCGKDRIPIYTSQAGSTTLEIEERKRFPDDSAMTIVRLGYNLFLEVAYLLRHGQPVEHAGTPALELHIGLLRDVIIQYTEYLIEIPSRPAGHSMIACLTHDVDHPSIRKSHLWPTLLGFFYRATLGSIIEVVRGRKSFAQLVINWRAAFSLPFICAGFGKDIWESFGTYSEIEKKRPSTYFFIPLRGCAGKDRDGVEHPKRAAAYAASELRDAIASLQDEGREVGVHGVDSWRDASKGAQERQAISELTGEKDIGVRMHWLYYDSRAPANLERAGYTYDSTVGYNDIVGFRAGTTQVFKPFGVSSLLELPLHVMDTALFYPDYLDLSPDQATETIAQIVSQTQRFGGVLTINWHDRSLAPERLWGEAYQNTIDQLTNAGAWFATCRDAVAWFRCRRNLAFDSVRVDASNVLCISIHCDEDRGQIPPAILRIYPGKSAKLGEGSDARYLDFEISKSSHDFHLPMHFNEVNEVCA